MIGHGKGFNLKRSWSKALPKYYRFKLVSFPPRHGPARPGHLSRFVRE